MAPVNKPMTPIDGEQNMNTGMASVLQLRGPMASGTVQMNLHELDQMRSDHATAVRMAKDLESKAMSVKIVLQERKEYQRLNERNRWVTDERLEEISVEWRNIEAFRCIIHDEEHKKVADEIAQLQSDIRQHVNAIRVRDDRAVETQAIIDRLQHKFNDLNSEHVDTLRENDMLTRTQAKHDIVTADLTKQLQDARAQVFQEIARKESARKELEAIREINSFGGHMARWFGFWPKQF